MAMKKLTCPVCSCFCDDIEVEVEDDRITKVENACQKGFTFLMNSQDRKLRTSCTVEGYEKEVNEAVAVAAEILSGSHNPLIFGLDNSSLEAQVVGIELAGKLKGVIDDNSSLSYGKVTEHILKGSLPTCSLSEVDKAELFIYWGANTPHSHPRHLSEFTY